MITDLLQPGGIRKGLWIVVLMVFNALLDFFSIAAFVPLIASIVNPDIIYEESIISGIYQYFGFESHTSFVFAISSAILVFVLSKNIASIRIARMKSQFAFDVRSEISSRLLERYLSSSFVEFTKADFSRQLNIIANYPLSLANNIILPISVLISEGLVTILVLICIAFYDPKVLVVVLLLLVPILLFSLLRREDLKKVSKEAKATYPKFLKSVNQAIEGFVEINAHQKQRQFHNRFQNISKQLSGIFVKDQTLQAGTSRLTEVMLAVVMFGLVGYSVVTGLAYQESLLLLGYYAVASYRVVPSVRRILASIQQIRTHEYIVQELRAAIHVEKTVRAGDQRVDFNESLHVKNVSFGYPGGEEIFSDVSLTVRKGERVAIIGPSGAGKSSLLLLMIGLVDPVKGEVLIDGEPVKNRVSFMGYLSQSPYILDGTLAENIAFGDDPGKVDRKRILEIAQQVGLNQVVAKAGIDMRVGERGALLSGGQRQRLALARCLYHNREILLLDEVSSQLDANAERELIDTILTLADVGKTVILVTHRGEHLHKFDSVYELVDSRLLAKHHLVESPRHL